MGKITRLELENFTCFAKLDLEFSNGVNVLIGAAFSTSDNDLMGLVVFKAFN